jgi:hypothetical protein
LEKEKIKLELDLELARKDLDRVQAELRASGGKFCWLNTSLSASSIFEPSDSTRADVRAENRRLQVRLNNAISLDVMKKALEDKDQALADAQRTAREKTEAAERKLAVAKVLEEENAKLKQERADWSRKLEGAVKRAKSLEVFIGDYAQKMFTLLEGNFLQSSELCQFQFRLVE